MANYISIPILAELVQFAEHDSEHEDSAKALASGVLNYYFTAINGFIVAPEQNKSNHRPDFIILRVLRRFLGDRGVANHVIAIAEAIKQAESFERSLEQLEDVLEQGNMEFGRCWAILVRGCTFCFYEYHSNLPANSRLIPWVPPGQSQNEFHGRSDSMVVDWMLRHIAQNTSPPGCE
ncbi:hypothetical protein FQN49_008216 [Arthroderma sp. PD_2]|nr:hypothetical protein FQN49_008216 [Arthroderma sp. PD_2]